jgi:hypothetical protein
VALLDPAPTTSHQPITVAEAKEYLHTGVWGDAAVLKLVIQDAEKAENYEVAKTFVAGWQAANILYQSPFQAQYWEGTAVPRSSIPLFTLATAVNSLVPQIMGGMFYENPPFIIQERPGTTSQEARAVGGLIAYQLDDINFRQELEWGVKNAVLAGTAIWKWGWETFTKERKVYRRKNPAVNIANPIPGGQNITVHDADEEIVEEIVEEVIDRPVFEHMANLKYVLVDPTLNVPDISKAKVVTHRMYMTWEDLDKLRDRPGYDIPSREEMMMLFLPPREPVERALAESTGKNPMYDLRADARFEDATIDPFNEPLEILERWTNDTCQVVLQKKAVIYNGANDYGKIPFLSVGWWDVPEAFFSMGLAKMIGSEQMIQQGIVNKWADVTTMLLNPVIRRKRGKSVTTQNIRMAPGKIVEIEDKDDMQPMERLPGVPEAGEHIALSQSRVDQIAGAGALNTSGMAAGHSNLARTAEGAKMLGSSGTTVPSFVDKLSNQVLLPFLYAVQEMNSALLPMSTIRRILSDELQHEYMKKNGDPLNLLNAKIKFSVLAGSKMSARQKMAQALPILTQYLMNEQTTQQLAIAGYRVDNLEIFRMMFEVSEFKNEKDVIVKMTPEEMKRAQQNSPAAIAQIKGQQAQQAQAQKHQNNLEIVDDENIARAGREVLRATMEKASEPLEVTGQAGGQYNPT